MKNQDNKKNPHYHSDDLSIEETYIDATINNDKAAQEKVSDWFDNELDNIFEDIEPG